MSIFKQFLLSIYFIWLTIFLIVFCLSSVILLKADHPLYIFSMICAPVLFLLQRYRKALKRKTE